MSQIDALLQYASKAAALADPALAAFVRHGDFDRSRVFDNGGAGLQVWNSTQDTTSTATVMGQAVTVTVHQFQPGYALIASYVDATIAAGTANPSAASLAPFRSNAACLLIADRDAADAGLTAVPSGQSLPQFVYYAAAAIAAALAQWHLQPVPLGSAYPFGAP